MKKYLALLLVIILAIHAACAAPPETGETEGDSVADFVDLSGLSTTMLKGELNNIMQSAEDYVGAELKMDGYYYGMSLNGTDWYHYIIVEPADPCCMQGLELAWPDQEDTYPEPYAKLAVTGAFSSYEDKGLTYYYLDVKDFIF